MKGIQEKLREKHPAIRLRAFEAVYLYGNRSRVRYWAVSIFGGLVLTLFLPWTQSIRSAGTVTALRQENRAQEVNSIIAGRIISWHVKEGDFVQGGDTLAVLAEVKDAYLDPQLLRRTEEQIAAKSTSIDAYGQKMSATEAQMSAIAAGRNLKLSQLQNKVQQLRLKVISDSIEMIAAINDFKIAEAQYTRQQAMRDSGLASLAQVEGRSASYQSALAKKTSAEIKWSNSKTDLVNARIEQSAVIQEYAEKSFKVQGDRAAALSDRSATEAELSKLRNQFSNYSIRASQYFLVAPQSGQVMAATKAGINEMVKEGEKLLEIVPVEADRAVELFVRPLDLPLLRIGQKVRFLFDGYPAIVFSGWPAASYGTFGGVIAAIETNVGPSGKFRVLVAEDSTDRKWPASLSLGTGAQGFALLRDVRVGYELWRNINGFPPDFYELPKEGRTDANKK